MFDIGWQELFIVAIIGLIVVGPKDLPRALKTITQYVRKARGMARDFQNGIDEVVREAELDDIKNDFKDVVEYDIEEEVSSALDPGGDLTGDLRQIETDMQDSLDSPEEISNDPYLPAHDDALEKSPEILEEADNSAAVSEAVSDPTPDDAPDKANG